MSDPNEIKWPLAVLDLQLTIATKSEELKSRQAAYVLTISEFKPGDMITWGAGKHRYRGCVLKVKWTAGDQVAYQVRHILQSGANGTVRSVWGHSDRAERA